MAVEGEAEKSSWRRLHYAEVTSLPTSTLQHQLIRCMDELFQIVHSYLPSPVARVLSPRTVAAAGVLAITFAARLMFSRPKWDVKGKVETFARRGFNDVAA